MTEKRLQAKTYSDVAYVEGVFKRDPIMERALFNHCKQYFDEHYKGVFFVGNDKKNDIFQESFTQFWKIIINRRIYIKDGEVLANGGKPLASKLTTFFMGIAKLKYLEWTRQKSAISYDDPEVYKREKMDMENLKDMMYDKEEERMLEIISECISKMAARCNQILTLFYCKKKTLDDIMNELPSFGSKDALKTAKYKCMEHLRESARSMRQLDLNS